MSSWDLHDPGTSEIPSDGEIKARIFDAESIPVGPAAVSSAAADANALSQATLNLSNLIGEVGDLTFNTAEITPTPKADDRVDLGDEPSWSDGDMMLIVENVVDQSSILI